MLDREEGKNSDLFGKFETESGENRVEGWQGCEVDVTIAVGRGWRQPHGAPASSVERVYSGERGPVGDGQVGPVLDVVSKIIHVDGSRSQRMAKSMTKVWQPSSAVSKMQPVRFDC